MPPLQPLSRIHQVWHQGLVEDSSICSGVQHSLQKQPRFVQSEDNEEKVESRFAHILTRYQANLRVEHRWHTSETKKICRCAFLTALAKPQRPAVETIWMEVLWKAKWFRVSVGNPRLSSINHRRVPHKEQILHRVLPENLPTARFVVRWIITAPASSHCWICRYIGFVKLINQWGSRADVPTPQVCEMHCTQTNLTVNLTATGRAFRVWNN